MKHAHNFSLIVLIIYFLCNLVIQIQSAIKGQIQKDTVHLFRVF